MTMQERLDEVNAQAKLNLKLKFRGEGVILGPDGKEKCKFTVTGEQKDGDEHFNSTG